MQHVARGADALDDDAVADLGRDDRLLHHERRAALARLDLRKAGVALRPAMPTRWSGVSDDLAAVLDGPRACPCIQVDGVLVEAGRPEVV